MRNNGNTGSNPGSSSVKSKASKGLSKIRDHITATIFAGTALISSNAAKADEVEVPLPPTDKNGLILPSDFRGYAVPSESNSKASSKTSASKQNSYDPFADVPAGNTPASKFTKTAAPSIARSPLILADNNSPSAQADKILNSSKTGALPTVALTDGIILGNTSSVSLFENATARGKLSAEYSSQFGTIVGVAVDTMLNENAAAHIQAEASSKFGKFLGSIGFQPDERNFIGVYAAVVNNKIAYFHDLGGIRTNVQEFTVGAEVMHKMNDTTEIGATAQYSKAGSKDLGEVSTFKETPTSYILETQKIGLAGQERVNIGGKARFNVSKDTIAEVALGLERTTTPYASGSETKTSPTARGSISTSLTDSARLTVRGDVANNHFGVGAEVSEKVSKNGTVFANVRHEETNGRSNNTVGAGFRINFGGTNTVNHKTSHTVLPQGSTSMLPSNTRSLMDRAAGLGNNVRNIVGVVEDRTAPKVLEKEVVKDPKVTAEAIDNNTDFMVGIILPVSANGYGAIEPSATIEINGISTQIASSNFALEGNRIAFRLSSIAPLLKDYANGTVATITLKTTNSIIRMEAKKASVHFRLLGIDQRNHDAPTSLTLPTVSSLSSISAVCTNNMSDADGALTNVRYSLYTPEGKLITTNLTGKFTELSPNTRYGCKVSALAPNGEKPGSFNLVETGVTYFMTGANEIPKFSSVEPNIEITAGEIKEFALPTASDTETPTDKLVFSLALANGAGLPAGFKFDPTRKVISTDATAPVGAYDFVWRVMDANGGVAEQRFSITVKPFADMVPDNFSFGNVVNALRSTSYESSVVVSGINVASPITASAGVQYSIDGAAWTSNAGTVKNGQTVRMRITSASSYSTVAIGTIIIGGVPGYFYVTTGADVIVPPSNAAPTIVTPATFSVNQGATSALQTFTVNDANGADKELVTISTTSGTILVLGAGAGSTITNNGSGSVTISNVAPGTNLTYRLVAPATGSVMSTVITYTANDGHGGTVTTSSGATFVDATVPVGNTDNVNGTMNTPINGINVLGNDTDNSGVAPTLTGLIRNQMGGAFTVSGGLINFVPNAGVSGFTASAEYQIRDAAGNLSWGRVNVNIGADSTPPVAGADSVSTAFNAPLTAINVLANDTDNSGDTPTLTGNFQNAVGGTFVVNAGKVDFAPAVNFVGAASAQYEIMDAAGNKTWGTLTVTVNPLVDVTPPVAGADSVSTAFNAPLTAINVLANDTDNSGDTPTLTGNFQNAVGGTFVVNAGKVDFAPAVNFVGAASAQYEITDAAGNKTWGTLTVTVNPLVDVTPPPTASLSMTGNADAMPGYTNSLTVSLNISSVVDNGGGAVRYLVTESNTPPDVGDAGWSTTRPTSHTFTNGSNGIKTAYVWTLDNNGNLQSTPGSSSIDYSGSSFGYTSDTLTNMYANQTGTFTISLNRPVVSVESVKFVLDSDGSDAGGTIEVLSISGNTITFRCTSPNIGGDVFVEAVVQGRYTKTTVSTSIVTVQFGG